MCAGTASHIPLTMSAATKGEFVEHKIFKDVEQFSKEKPVQVLVPTENSIGLATVELRPIVI